MTLFKNAELDHSFTSQASAKPKPLLDMISVDMDFEQAYSMYSTLQQQNAIQSVEQLEKAQLQHGLLGTSLTVSHPSIFPCEGQSSDQRNLIEPDAFNNRHPARSQPVPFPNQEYANAREMLDFGFDRFQIASGPHRDSLKDHQVVDQFFSNTELDALERFLDTLANTVAPHRTSSIHELPEQWNSHEGLSMPYDLYTNRGAGPLQELEYVNGLMRTFDEIPCKVSQFQSPTGDHSHTASENHPGHMTANSGDKRLHDLMLSQDVYSHDKPMASHNFTGNLSWTKPSSAHNGPLRSTVGMLVQSLPPFSPTKNGNRAKRPLEQNIASQGTTAHQWDSARIANESTLLLISPPLSDTALAQCTDIVPDHEHSYEPQPKRRRPSDVTDLKFGDHSNTVACRERLQAVDVTAGQPGRRRRLASKPLLSLEQKRLNHSFSEQKRRLMCKMAYDRCLRLVIDIDLFQKIASQLVGTYRRKDRVGYNCPAMDKDGMPKLSKHNALMRISNEILLLQSMNESLMKIIYGSEKKEDMPTGTGSELRLATS